MPTSLDRTICPAVHIRGARLLDPASGIDSIGDLAIAEGQVVDRVPPDARVIEAADLIVAPGFADIHVHLREPGQSHKETIASGTAAAAAGGFVLVACMPNTVPCVDSPEIVSWILAHSAALDLCAVAPMAAITVGREGKQITDFEALLQAGAAGFSDDGSGVESDKVMAEAFAEAERLGTVLIQHCEYAAISAGGVMNAGPIAERLGLPGLDPRSEEAMIERDLDLCRRFGARYHVAHISTAKAVELVRGAKKEGLPVTAEVTPHHLLLTEVACAEADPNTKMHPPLRTAADVQACRAALADGTINCVATDHAPHAADEKARGFVAAPPGVIGLETAVGLTAKAMIETGLADWPALVRWFAHEPYRVLGRKAPALTPGSPANLTLIDPRAETTIDTNAFQSKGRNTPFAGWGYVGQPIATVRGMFLIR